MIRGRTTDWRWGRRRDKEQGRDEKSFFSSFFFYFLSSHQVSYPSPSALFRHIHCSADVYQSSDCTHMKHRTDAQRRWFSSMSQSLKQTPIRLDPHRRGLRSPYEQISVLSETVYLSQGYQRD